MAKYPDHQLACLVAGHELDRLTLHRKTWISTFAKVTKRRKRVRIHVVGDLPITIFAWRTE